MRFLAADQIFDGTRFLPDHPVLVLDNQQQLKEIVSPDLVEQGEIERLEGILMPGFVNSHCHLELSHMKGLISRHTGLPGFAKQIILNRNTPSPEEQAEHMQEADRDMWAKGIVAVGDISNTDASFRQKTQSKITYHTFLELIGLQPKNAESVFEKGKELFQTLRHLGLPGSLAPHAPYSTSTELIRKIAGYDEEHLLPFSIHNQESGEENRFFEGQKNGFEELYAFLGLDLSWFKAPGSTSLASYAAALPRTVSLLVHNTVSSAADLSLAPQSSYWCFCPGANQYIENRLPEFNLFKTVEERICIGTDSLASNSSLDVVQEANLILGSAHPFSLQTLLSALTRNGAEALGISGQFGHLHPGKNAGLNLVTYTNRQLMLARKIL